MDQSQIFLKIMNKYLHSTWLKAFSVSNEITTSDPQVMVIHADSLISLIMFWSTEVRWKHLDSPVSSPNCLDQSWTPYFWWEHHTLTVKSMIFRSAAPPWSRGSCQCSSLFHLISTVFCSPAAGGEHHHLCEGPAEEDQERVRSRLPRMLRGSEWGWGAEEHQRGICEDDSGLPEEDGSGRAGWVCKER